MKGRPPPESLSSSAWNRAPSTIGPAPSGSAPTWTPGPLARLPPQRPAPTALGVIDAVIEDDPRDYGYRATVWTAPLLRRYLEVAHGICTSRKSVGRAIARLGIRWKRPRHRLGLRPETWRQAKGGSSAG